MLRSAPGARLEARTMSMQLPSVLSSARPGGRAGRLFSSLEPLLRPRLRPRFDRRLAGRRLLNDPGIAEKAGDPIGRQCADPEPMLDSLGFEGYPIGMRAIEHRIVSSQFFDK